jgi:antitoxin component of MazEF toxin-antitoxin module
MKKNSGENIQRIQVDAITGDYYIIIPEWMINELSWYEDTEIKIAVDGDELILSERENDE